MTAFASRQDVIDWLNAHTRQSIRLGCADSALRVVGVTDGIQELDACSTEIPYGELRTGVEGVQIAVSLHDDALSLHVLLGDPKDGRVPVSLPLSIPYERLRLALADTPEDSDLGRDEPDFSPYELLHFPRPD